MHLGQTIVSVCPSRSPTGPGFCNFLGRHGPGCGNYRHNYTPYLVVSYRRKVPPLSFFFSLVGREEYRDSDGMNFCRFTFIGVARNESLDVNGIKKVYLVVWQNNKHHATLRNGDGAKIFEKGGYLEEPVLFSPGEGKPLDIVFEVPTDSSADTLLALATENIWLANKYWLLPRYYYELMFEDIEGRFFDRRGVLVNGKGLDLRSTLDDKLAELKGGNPFPFIWQLSKIYASDAITSIRRARIRSGRRL